MTRLISLPAIRMSRLARWLPDAVDGRIRVLAWVSLVIQVLIVLTGGAVRLTASGLGCSTWPQCTPGSLVVTPEQGIHGFIEFGNRMVAVFLALATVATFVLVLRLRRRRPDLFWLAFCVGLYIPIQAVMGGITVLTNLNPYVVGLHFVLSVALVAASSAFVERVYHRESDTVAHARAVPRWFALTARATAVLLAVTIVVGVLTTGSGPHAGDADAARNGLDSELLQHLHSLPAYVTFGLTLVLATAALTLGLAPVRIAILWLAGCEFLQIAVGLLQANTGLPIVLVGIHLVVACMTAGAMTWVVLRTGAAGRSRRRGTTP